MRKKSKRKFQSFFFFEKFFFWNFFFKNPEFWSHRAKIPVKKENTLCRNSRPRLLRSRELAIFKMIFDQIYHIIFEFFQNCSRIPPPSASLKQFYRKVEIYQRKGYMQPLFHLHYLIFECFNFSGRYFVREADGSRILQDIQIFSSKKQPLLPN